MRKINRVIVHASATSIDMDIGVKEIRAWHTARGWADIGYHFVIRRSGVIETGRPITDVGAHTRGHNGDSIGVCLVGGVDADDKTKADANFTLQQYQALDSLIAALQHGHGNLYVSGHRDYAEKACPCFDVKALLNRK